MHKKLFAVLLGISYLFILNGCKTEPSENGDPRLTSQIRTPVVSPAIGLNELGLGTEKDGIFYVPTSYTHDDKWPLFVLLHGAGGTSNYWKSYRNYAEERNFILLAIDSRQRTWDLIIEDDYGEDVLFLDKALNYVFNRCNIDPDHIALGGFSDGATYSLSLGISNGDLFSHIIAFSPGYLVTTDPIIGKPLIFISHGTSDNVLPVESSRNNIVPYLKNESYDVTYEEFDGGHTVPTSMFEIALDWFIGPIINDPGGEQ